MRANPSNPWLSLALFLVATSVYGGLVAPQSILTLEKNADLIVAGTANALVQSGTTVNFSLLVSRVIKGDATVSATSIAAYWINLNQDPAGSGVSGDTNYSGVWFLQRTDNAWRVIPVVQGEMAFGGVYFPAPPGPIVSAYTYTDAAPLSDKLASEVSSALESADGYHLQFYFLQGGLLDELGSPVLDVFYHRMAASTAAAQRALGLGGLLRAGNASALAAAAQTASAHGGDAAVGPLLLSIREYFRPTDAASVVILGKAATDTSITSAAFREVAAHALAAIHTAAALPFLATLLDDSDLNLRIEAVGGMGAFANGLAVQTRAGIPSLAFLQLPGTAPYKTADTVAHFAFGRPAVTANEASLIAFWKGWWAQNRTSTGY